MRNILFLAAGLMLGTGCMTKYSPIVNTVDIGDVDWTNVKSMKRADGCRTMLFGVYPVGGSASVVNAIEKAKIAKVNAVDYRVKNFIVYTQSCVTVYGE